MRQVVLDQLSMTPKAFLSCLDTECLISIASQFFTDVLHPQEIFFCSEADKIFCFAHYQLDGSLQHTTSSINDLHIDFNEAQLWQLINQKQSFSACLPITHLSIKKANNEFDNWFCVKTGASDKANVYIFIKNPRESEIQPWKTSPLLASLMKTFFNTLHKFQSNHNHNHKLVKQETLYFQQLCLQQQFSSKILQLHKVTQSLISASTLDALYKIAVETLQELMEFDRNCLILIDPIDHTLTPTYGIDESGKTVDESAKTLELTTLDPLVKSALLNSTKLFETFENRPISTNKNVIKQGWNAIIILRDSGNLIGWISLNNLVNKCTLANHEKEILRLYSGILSSAIIKKREESHLDLLHESVVKLSHQKTELDICKTAVEFSRKKLKLDRVAIFLSYDDGKTMQGTFGTSNDGELIDETSFIGPLTKNALLKLALESENELVLDGAAPLYHNHEVVGYGWNAAVLLRNHGKVIGFLVLDNLINKRPLASHIKHLLSLFSTNLAEILARKRAEESVYKLNNELEQLVEQRTKQLENVNCKLEKSNKKLAQLSLIDGLTGIANRRHFDESYHREWATACRNQLSLSIVMLDIDYFKAYNDFYGHQQGDICLKRVAKILKKHFRRSGELVARYGGEEFVILISHAQAAEVNRRVQAAIEDLFSQNIEHLKTPLQCITLSAGVATFYINKNIPKDKLLKWADEALYQGKSEGKNRLVIFNRRQLNSL